MKDWLNGNVMLGSTVLIGSSLLCAGCGSPRGTTCVVIPEGYNPQIPDWPFDVEDCPVCSAEEEYRPIIDAEDIAKNFPKSVIGNALILRRQLDASK